MTTAILAETRGQTRQYTDFYFNNYALMNRDAARVLPL